MSAHGVHVLVDTRGAAESCVMFADVVLQHLWIPEH